MHHMITLIHSSSPRALAPLLDSEGTYTHPHMNKNKSLKKLKQYKL